LGCFQIADFVDSDTNLVSIALIPINFSKDSAVTKEIEVWDGKTGINEITGEVAGEQIIAGEKNKDNKFSGV
jgi:hypothetical protein